MRDILSVKQSVIETGKKLLETKLVRGTGGNISVRTDRGFLITPSGMDYMSLLPEDLVEMDLTGKVLCGSRTPSIEKELHRVILKERTDVSAIVHVHSTYATAVAAARSLLPAVTDNQVAFFGGDVLIAKYAPIGTPELAHNVAEALGGGGGVLLSNHGSLCVGRTLDEALFRCEMLEEFAKIYILALSVGGAVRLTQDEVSNEASDLKKRYGQNKA